jgi:hypothetical protein
MSHTFDQSKRPKQTAYSVEKGLGIACWLSNVSPFPIDEVAWYFPFNYYWFGIVNLR